jgi:1,4-alpha-glucan branching enzyme
MVRRAIVATVLALSTLGSSCASPLAQPPATTSAAGVAFVHVDESASSVAVTGTFNQWSASSHPMARAGATGQWTTMVRLPPGEYQYLFVVDGTRLVVPVAASEYVEDGFGSRNAVVVVPAER